jgi:hypothetical protein
MATPTIPNPLLAGQRFGRLTLVKIIHCQGSRKNGKKRFWRSWECLCDCGRTTAVPGRYLRSSNTRSCGCRIPEVASERKKIHGLSNTPLHHRWCNILTRCENPHCADWPRYGGRGIAVCHRWHSFEHFLADMGHPPSPQHTIDRIDNDGGYWCGRLDCPDCGPAQRIPNCRWATPREQEENKENKRRLDFQGECHTVAEWARKLGLSYKTLSQRVWVGWSTERALTEPINVRCRNRPKAGWHWGASARAAVEEEPR